MNLTPNYSWRSAVEGVVAEILPEIRDLRRHLHRHPELSEEEFQTTEYLAAKVRGAGIEPHLTSARRGLWCDLIAGSHPSRNPQGPYLAIRGDIDALPICDAKGVDYRSTRDGIMHACGHDAHTAILYGTLRVLRELSARGQLPWPVAVRGLFQPSEETGTGALLMIREGALEGVAAAIALHVDPSRSVGSIGLRAGTLTAACDTLRIEILGRGGHGARPHLTLDPIEATAAWIIAALRRVPRAIDVHRAGVFSVGKISAGVAPNVIPESAVLEGTLRSLAVQTRETAIATLENVNRAIAAECGVQIQMTLLDSTPPVVNDSALIQIVAHGAGQLLGEDALQWIAEPSMGGEDFAFYLDHIPGAMFRLGIAGAETGSAPLHTPTFDLDERGLGVGMMAMVGAAVEYFAPRTPPSRPS